VPGIVLHGPSGCGKSMLARVIASQARASFIAVQATDIFSMYLGESEARLRAIFSRARKALPCIVFLDELDAIAIKRDGGDTGDAVGSVYARVLSTLLNEMDGMEGRAEGLLILAATCRIDAIDAALLRPGRLQEVIQLRLPDPQRDFVPILTVACDGIPLAEGVELQRLVDELLMPIVGIRQGGRGAGEVTVTAAELRAFCREAAMEALRQDIHGSTVQWTHFKKAQRRLWPQVSL
jgi:SpoVK/Ycf46/Vps4 family AAA+-type ATPase